MNFVCANSYMRNAIHKTFRRTRNRKLVRTVTVATRTNRIFGAQESSPLYGQRGNGAYIKGLGVLPSKVYGQGPWSGVTGQSTLS